ncbi:MAG: GTPase [Nanoarchaeota archaeon]
MPINATPQYGKLEEKYSEAKTTIEKIKALEAMLKEAPSHKGAETLRAALRSRLAKLKDLSEKEKKTGARQATGLKKEGTASISIIGLTNSGKSTFLSKITNAKPKIAEYPYTTKEIEVGIFEYEGVKLQLIEIPAINKNFMNKPRGREIMSIVRSTNMIILLVIGNEEEMLKEELHDAGIILDRKRPAIKITKTGSGGIEIIGKIKGSKEEVMAILKGHHIHNGTLEIHGSATPQEIEEGINERIVFLPLLVIRRKYNTKELGKELLKKLQIIRVYTKQPGKEKETNPIALKKWTTIEELGREIHKDFTKSEKSWARVWGKSAKHQGMRTGMDHILEDGDIVELHMARG